MQHETVVLEMFSRIKILEEKVEGIETLKNRIDIFEKRIEKLEKSNTLVTHKVTSKEYYEEIQRLMQEYDDLKMQGNRPEKSKRDYVGEKLNISGRQVSNIINKFQQESDKKKKDDISDSMIEKCYAAGKLAYKNKKAKLWDLAEKIHTETGMNERSAYLTIYAVKDLLNGNEYRISIGAEHIDKFLHRINIDYGKEGLEKAIKSLDEYIKYKQKPGYPLKKLTSVNNKYKELLNS